ncbi:MAG: hypothetical protein A3G73_01560 [Rhodospirillales bacterium RIFCSPLOWO2_12_FULL_67_15]|nr:MAG: hypothetical protein A3G73_01560 [Rhodospirillales bacterium RIFCSPLOWO2_12_FULL_67_15]
MIVVVDASVAAMWFLPEPHSESAALLLDAKCELIAPDLMRLEVANALAQAARAGRSELATWSAGLRSRLRNRYVGDVTADIRSDRQR